MDSMDVKALKRSITALQTRLNKDVRSINSSLSSLSPLQFICAVDIENDTCTALYNSLTTGGLAACADGPGNEAYFALSPGLGTPMSGVLGFTNLADADIISADETEYTIEVSEGVETEAVGATAATYVRTSRTNAGVNANWSFLFGDANAGGGDLGINNKGTYIVTVTYAPRPNAVVMGASLQA